MKKVSDLKKKWMKDKKFKKEYDDLSHEFHIAKALIKARKKSGLTQEEIAEKMGTTQSVIARIESGKNLPSLKTLFRYADATQFILDIKFKKPTLKL